MKRCFIYFMASMTVYFAACSVEGSYNGSLPEQKQMILKVRENGEKHIYFGCSRDEKIRIIWGDGERSDIDLYASYNQIDVSHTYSSAEEHTITISGDIVQITQFDCQNINVTSLDVSNLTKLKVLKCSQNRLLVLNIEKNTELEDLACNNNKLTNLDVTNNNKMNSLDVSSNQLNVAALNSLIGTLHSSNISGKIIYIGNNPGTEECQKNLAETKNWTVNTARIYKDLDE